MMSQERENCGREHVGIDINDLTYSSDTLVSGNFVMSPKCCIFKIPIILSRHNEKAYAPNAFSIGPWNLGKRHLKPTQKIKNKYLQGLIRRSPNPDQQMSLLEDAIRAVEKDARECYAGPVEIDAPDCNARPVVPSVQDLVQILVLDGCFIIELFRKDAKVVAKDEDDPIFTMSCMLQFLYHDLILLENQIPWFVLEILFDMTKTQTPESKPLDQLAILFFSNMFSSQNSPEEMIKSLQRTKFRSHKSKHILDLLRNWLILSLETAESGEGGNQNLESREGGSNQISGSGEEVSNVTSGWQPLPCATSLKDAGIKFRKVTSNSILDVQFRNGGLEMPSLLVQETTETIFRNLISFEQCTPNYTPVITSYAKLLDNLIDTTKDVEIFCKNEIIDNWLNLDDATQFFNRLYTDAYFKEFHYHQLCHDVNVYCRNRWPRWRANLMQKYFNNPWGVVGVVVAGLILVLTIIGTVCSILQVI